MKSKVKIIFIFATLFAVLNLGSHFRSVNKEGDQMASIMKAYDDSTGQQPILSHVSLDSVLDQLTQVPYENLPKEYLTYTGSQKIETVLKYKYYYKVNGTDVLKYVTGHFRIGDLLSKDTFYNENLRCLPTGCEQFWLCDKKLLHKFLDLILWMKKQGYNDSAITVKNGHRHPGYNSVKGGVSRSYHMQGMAIDIKVGDINRDGIADATDKNILLQILETDIIADEGGLGRYPKSDVIHFDTRGYRARWDAQ